jgi:uncharacterized protein involved in oxidation of intracellular sulfur
MMDATTFILNAAPYGSESTYNALRLAGLLAKREDHKVCVFLMGDAASAAHRNQKVPQGYYNVEVMIGNVVRNGGQIAVCGTCMDARGIDAEHLADGCKRGSLEELADWTDLSDKVLVF